MKKISKLCLSFLLASSLSSAFADTKISEIVVSGNKRIEKATIESYLKFKPGDFISNIEQNQAIRNLYATDLFQQINVEVRGNKLLVDVKENPLVVKVKLEGNKKKNKDEIEKEITLKKGDSLSSMKIHNDIAKIKEIYKAAGRYVTEVQPLLNHLDDNRVFVTYKITEGPKSGVRNIYFVGNKAYRDYELKAPIMTKEDRWFRFMSQTSYNPGLLEYDKESLKNFYHSVGYADFRVVSATAELSPGKDYFDVTFVVDEGRVYQIASVKIENEISEIDDSMFKNLIKVESGDIYNIRKIDAIARRITERLADRGFLDAACSPKYNKNPRNNTVDVIFSVGTASKYHLNRINITGNLKTFDNVIRREFGIHEGDAFNQSLIRLGEQKVRGLDYFENVRVTPKQTEGKAGLVDLDVEVEEKSTASAHLQGSWSSARKLGGEIGFNERNFFGSGRDLGFNGSIFQGGAKSINFSLHDPHFMDSNVSQGFAVGLSDTSGGKSFQAYNKTTKYGRVSFGYDLTEDLSHSINYSLKHANLNYDGLDESKATDDDKKKVSEERKKFNKSFRAESVGKFFTSAVTNSLTYNQMDSRYAPKNGFLVSGSQEFAGVGGDIKFLKHELDVKFAKSFFDNQYTLLLSGSVGHVTGVFGAKVRPDDRFQLGDFDFRGFAMNGIGPRLEVTAAEYQAAKAAGGLPQTGEALSGKKSYTMTAEMQFPLVKDMNISGSLFLDAGALWDYDFVTKDFEEEYKNKIVDKGTLHASFGACVSIILPMMPIKICYAIPFLYDKDNEGNPIDELQNIHFRFTTGF
jgi:outer membrane protein insertion porin family